MSKIKLFANIEKIEDQDDGTIIVHGVASTESVDSQNEIVTADAMKGAIPDYMKFGAIREMHQPMAAGTALKCEVGDDGITRLEAHIVDPVAVLKVKENVYKGFSIGGKVKNKTKDDTTKVTTIHGLRLTEISLVDVPANPDAVMSFGKAEYPDSAETLLKSLWDVQSFAELIQRLFWLCCSAQDEAEWEGDASPLPAKLAEWLRTGGQLLQEMTAEEVAELMGMLPAPAMTIETITASAKLAKAGAKFSAKTKEVLGDVHKMLQEGCDKMSGLGYDKDDLDSDKSEEITNLKKSLDDNTAKVESLETELSKVNAERDSLAKEKEELETKLKSQPAVAKGNLLAVPKGKDAGSEQPAGEVAPIRKGNGELDEAATAMKAVHAAGPIGRG